MRTHDEVLRELAAARPHSLDPDRPVDRETRATELAAILEHTAPGTGDATVAPAPGDHSPSPRRTGTRRARWAGWGRLAVVGATAAAVAGVTLAGVLLTGDGRDGAAGRSAARGENSLSRVLLAAAEAIEEDAGEATGEDGRYWYREVRRGWLTDAPGRDYRLSVRLRHETWTAGTDRWESLGDFGARPATERDRERWRADGSPRTWTLDDGRPWVGSDRYFDDAPGGRSGSRSPVTISPAELRNLPEETEALEDRLHTLADEEFEKPGQDLRSLVHTAAEHLALDLPATPGQRAAAYRILAGQPGVRDLGEVTDHSGRPGYGVAVPSRHGDRERHLVFDRETGLLLGEEIVALRDGAEYQKGELIGWTVVTQMRWTDTPPPHEEDHRDDDPADDADGGPDAPAGEGEVKTIQPRAGSREG
ncbi:CU044_5270 family protein [Streptomyces sp. JJ36]|uniref:CU044_5270 family protein n=1 Tax=Streptomyces sp. JJ36 TaxID=2736645 RepID=UPI001F26EF46|nr:CU044_5270 family protein [Streptomyces sp. JJ36]MCF6524068.1 CU044_5270 family protein [Streptomyces sp. JJ36]